jgi:methylenetetrahydrofolate dehydrogenase (NADP+)/methenyltetrahydrofolate cyclohydrolase
MANLISGKELSANIREQLAIDIEAFKNEFNYVPKLVVVMLGDHPASKSYVTAKERGAKKVGMESELILKPDTMTEDELLTLIDELNNDSSVTGILVQLPLPKHIDSTKVIHAIKPIKDVDGFHPENIGNFMIGGDALMSCTPAGIITMLESIDVKLEGAHAVVVGRSNIVGKPVSQMLLSKNCTVTVCHSRTKDLGAITRQADILVAAVGRAKMITEDMVKDGAVVIDVGVNRVDGKLVGDVDFETIKEKASFITPVPGGVGPMTITTLLTNTLKAAKLQNK